MKAVGVTELCRMDGRLTRALSSSAGCDAPIRSACATIIVGAACFGAVFGLWCSPQQSLYAAIKLPPMIFTVVLSSALINTMLAQVLGMKVSFKQVCTCMLLSFAIMSALLASFSPIMLYILSQTPASSDPSSESVYGCLLAGNTALVGFCGTLGVLRLYRLLVILAESKRVAKQTLCIWVGVCGLIGCELSWLFSPFLARPGVDATFINPNAFKNNFFEYLWQAICCQL